MFEDKVELDVHGLHSVLNNCRKNSPWYTGLQFFSKAVGQGVKPNAVVYLELLRMLEHAHPMPNRWRYGLAILSALQGRVDVTAGHYNSVLATLGGGHWQRGVQLFHTMRENSVQPSKETLHTLLLLQPNNVSHTIRCIAEAHTLGMPVTDTMYRALLTGLVRRSLDHEAVKFIDKELSRDTVDTGNPVRTTLPLMTALLDTLLAHPRPHDALVMAETFENKLSDVVGASTRNLAEIGSATLRWLVQGRVAIVDHNVLLSPRFQSLIHHYDSIFIPFSSVRLLVRRAREGGDSVQGRYMRTVLLRLREMLNQPEWRMVRVLPFVHQLTAHRYIAEEEPFSTEALEEMREEAKKLPSSFGQQLLNGISGVGDTARDTLAIREVDQPAPAVITTKKKRGIFLRHKDTLTSIERVLSVAVMIKSLNPDADVHVLSTNARQLELVEKWNGFTTDEAQHGQTLQAVLYPSELFDKAPPPDASSAVVEEKEETQESALDSSKLPFIPS
ncbi:hypothetical protein AGDE_11728 [Angomonas deanei]|uniref:Uncharacterized protein n=1 Tax=Angomonas deanei TaxID=59799 RepID=A0A7G2CK54_9TRYP|nr:hypothetical protein AGDE_11728 [Angomonas deanei]CAD2218592.1 hypothetical protein, conserved [Angomonas deanei]|eukprot:EPY25479.1 hypothetical protein AGDE_11728 [Angomonas deanei]